MPISPRQLDEGVVLALDQHVAGALKALFFVANERVSLQDFSHPGAAKPTSQGRFAK